MATKPKKKDSKDFSWKRVAILVAVAIPAMAAIALVPVLAMRHRHFLNPTNPIQVWALLDTVADTVAAAAAVAVAGAAVIGLRSLSLTRTEMVNRAKREGKHAAIQRLEELAKELIPDNIPILTLIGQAKVTAFVNVGGIAFDPDPKDLTAARAWVKALPQGAESQIIGFLNRLEAWSTYFTTGVADEEVAFGPVAPVLRAWIGLYYPILLILRANRRSGVFPNLVTLYSVWTDKMDEAQLAQQMSDVEAQLERHRYKKKLPGVIGSDIDE